MNKSYQETVSSFPFKLPEGVAFPKEAPSQAEDEKNHPYAAGVGGMQAYFFYQCAQETVALANRTADPARAIKALDGIVEMNQASFWKEHTDDSAGTWANVLSKARLGDYAELAESYDTDCGDDWSQGRVK